MKETGRAEFYTATDEEAIQGTYLIVRHEQNLIITGPFLNSNWTVTVTINRKID